MKVAHVLVPYAGYYTVRVEVEDEATDEDAFEEALNTLGNMTNTQLSAACGEEEWLPKLITDYGSKEFSFPDEFEVDWEKK